MYLFPSSNILLRSVVFARLKTFLTHFSSRPFYSQELVSVNTEGKTGNLTVLGNIKHKMVCSPDFEALLESSS